MTSVQSPPAILTLEDLQLFTFEQVINEDPITRSVTLLGTYPIQSNSDLEGKGNATGADDARSRAPAIVRIEQLTWGERSSPDLVGRVYKAQSVMWTDIYSTFTGWVKEDLTEPNVKISVICPASEIHIRKYSKQEVSLVQETPHLYETIVKPYIDSFPPSRTQWVDDILAGKSEADRVLFSSDLFILLPDMKWDCVTVSSLYLVAIARSPKIKSLRDLRRADLALLHSIKENAGRVVLEKWGLGKGGLRMYIHYQPSYYHFHVHIVNANAIGFMGMRVGQSHLLEDVISLVELSSEDGPSILERMTLTYGLGKEHRLFNSLTDLQS